MSQPDENLATEQTQDSSPPYLISVSPTPPSLADCTKFVSHPSCGAISTFIGTTRDTFDGRRVLKLSYEGYEPMAEKVLKELCQTSRDKFPGVLRIAAVHRLGDCPVGMESVIIAVSSVHRRDGLDCVAWLIDELKGQVPIWKKEVYEGDEAAWKENVEWVEGRRRRVMVRDGEDGE
mmetsp:Transcript_9440/g.11652  ORF Transcript_9440/g.11652 Transcript_9440/m.11652 type:complete len:177 (+) Transcript_9440:136-666(+)|eukprot:CAMPEP_0172484224 /NCGR_PEP_ID=MMETSP1066-20121228/11598_1 /TAXON_ID=671091 /ORGANISM="Coscinodiscus wailesii, Strain CCMP2513" /LENGTH=176 /DNA_ID=CAMNT_0013248587 /DNA_START=128 /DNA_END=658 /DNA_ORIENTATION=+